MKTITVVGLGYIGLPTAITLARAGFDVCGFDVNAAVLEKLSAGHLHIAEPGLKEAFNDATQSGHLTFNAVCPASDAYIICVPTPFSSEGEKRRADLRYVKSAAEVVARAMRPGALVILESTVPPKTTEMMAETLESVSGISRNDFYTAHCPERIIPGRMLTELRENDRIIGASSERAAQLTVEIYSRLVDVSKLHVTDDITAEMCKLTENTYRDVNIAFANELSMICDQVGVDVFKLIELANCHPRVNILSPGAGVGGHCIAVDPWFIHERFEDDTPLILAARLENDKKPHYVANKVAQLVAPASTIAVLGMAYKPDVDDLRESPSIEICRCLKKLGFTVICCEPNTYLTEIEGFPNLSLEDAVKASSMSVITLGHREFKANKETIAASPFFDCIGLMR
ncbi:MAG: nucleotide sugar dehydrogenase [Clostridia bacterium]